MSKFNVVLLKLPTLYEILTEIKLELNFNLINFDESNDKFKKFIEENPEVLIISPDLKGNYKNFISYNKVFKIKNLLQQINIYLSKSNYEIKSKISIGSYFVDTNSRIISRENKSLKLTEKEIDLLTYLNKSKIECSSVDLQKNVWNQSGDLETHTVETHIYRLRKKIVDMFSDKNFIVNTNNGYKISK
tara:strand:+ start:2358 stop:2924 length:567 start_codon:yes stop_codon:yes gene_type:complete